MKFGHIRGCKPYPDGGVARLKVYGEVFKNWDLVDSNEQLDMKNSALNGGKTVCVMICSSRTWII